MDSRVLAAIEAAMAGKALIGQDFVDGLCFQNRRQDQLGASLARLLRY